MGKRHESKARPMHHDPSPRPTHRPPKGGSRVQEGAPPSIQNNSKPDTTFSWFDIEWQCGRIQEEGEQALHDAFSGPKWTTVEQLRGLETDLDTLKLRVTALRMKLERWEPRV